MKIFIYSVSVLIILFFSTGCMNLLTGRSSITSEDGSNTKITLKTVSMHGDTDSNASAYKQITAEFVKEHSYINISDESQTSCQKWKTKITADFTTSNEPDVIQFFTDENARDILATDKFVTIAEIQAVYPDYAANIFPEALAVAANPDGVSRAVPTVGFWEGLYCNKDLFDKYSIPLPTDWDSLAYAIKIFNQNDIVPISVSLNHIPHYFIEYMLLLYTGPCDYNNIPKSTPDEWVEGMEMIKTLNEMGAFPKNTDIITNAIAENLFKEKKAAMMLNGSWFLSGIPDQENTVVIHFPNITGNSNADGAIIGGMSTGFYITKKAWNDPERRDAAVRFVMAHTSNDSIYRYWHGSVQPAAAVPLPDNMTPLALSALEYCQSATSFNPPIDSKLSHESYNIFVNNIVDVIFYNKPAQELIDEVLQVHYK